ncbi:MAG: tetratricopeptide repeat protein [Candidatus Woesearchaeota archaeon]
MRKIAAFAIVAVLLLALLIQAEPASASPIPSGVYVFIGNYFFNRGSYDTAANFFESAIKKDNNSVAHHNMGVIYYEKGDNANAESEFRNALAANDNYAKAHNSLALLLFHEGKYEEAAGHFTKVIELEPKNAQAHFDLGVSIANNVRYNNGNIGDLSAALEHFKAAERLQPGYPHALQNIDVMETILEKYYELKLSS